MDNWPGNAISGALFNPDHPFVRNLNIEAEASSGSPVDKLSSLARLAGDISGERNYANLAELKSTLQLAIATNTPSLVSLFEGLEAKRDYGFSIKTLLTWVEAMENGRGDEFLNRIAAGNESQPQRQTLDLSTSIAPRDFQLQSLSTAQIPLSAPIDSNKLIAMKAVLEATHIDLHGLVDQAINLSEQVNANLPAMASDFARSLAEQTNLVLDQIKDGALRSVHQFSTKNENRDAVELREKNGQPLSRSLSHRLATSETTDTDNFPKNTSLTTGGGSMNMTGSAINIDSGFKAAVASFGKGEAPEHDIEITDHGVHVHVEPGESGFVAAAGGASVSISAPTISISIGSTVITRG